MIKTTSFDFFALLTLIFLGLKAAGLIEWSWFMVFWPLWAPIALVAGACVLMLACLLAVFLFVVVFDSWWCLTDKQPK